MVPPTFAIDVAVQATCERCGKRHDLATLLRKLAFPFGGRLLLTSYCDCGGSWFRPNVDIEPIGVVPTEADEMRRFTRGRGRGTGRRQP